MVSKSDRSEVLASGSAFYQLCHVTKIIFIHEFEETDVCTPETSEEEKSPCAQD